MQTQIEETITERLKKEIDDFIAFMPSVADTPPEVFDREFQTKLDGINRLSLACPQHRPVVMKHFFERSGAEFDKGAVQKQSRYKPFGYAGDYLIIDWTYTQKADSPGVGAEWDRFYHRQDAPSAVRNRKDYFCRLYARMCAE